MLMMIEITGGITIAYGKELLRLSPDPSGKPSVLADAWTSRRNLVVFDRPPDNYDEVPTR